MEIISQLFEQLKNELIVLGMAATPVIELRGSIPVGILNLKMNWVLVLVLSIIGNILPVPFIVIYMRPLFATLKKNKYLHKLVHWVETRTAKKAEKMMKYSALGLFLFVAIPFPGTGAWTGSMIAAFLDMRLRYAFPSIIAGVLGAAALVTAGTMFAWSFI